MVGDCVIRAISKVENKSWEDVFVELMTTAYSLSDMPSSNYVVDQYLKSKGFIHRNLPNTCPDCYTARDFANEHQDKPYIVATGSHMIGINKNIYDSWDSSDEIVTYYYEKEENNVYKIIIFYD